MSEQKLAKLNEKKRKQEAALDKLWDKEVKYGVAYREKIKAQILASERGQ